jgi:electron transport complex protein RnfB
VCPVDAIIGGSKHMHTVIEPLCTGCELCVPACPVDCIELIAAA